VEKKENAIWGSFVAQLKKHVIGRKRKSVYSEKICAVQTTKVKRRGGKNLRHLSMTRPQRRKKQKTNQEGETGETGLDAFAIQKEEEIYREAERN